MEIGKVVCFSFSLNAHESMAYVRLIAPLRHLGIQIIDGLQVSSNLEATVAGADLVILQREFPVRFSEYQRVVKIAQDAGKPILVELDDLLFLLPEDHPDRQGRYYAPALLPMLQAIMEADAITVPTLAMHDFLQDYNENIFVVPNYLDDTLWSFRPPSCPDSPFPVVIGYMGTHSHKPDLEYITPVLLSLLSRYPQGLQLRFWGIQPPEELSRFPQVEWIPCDYRSYEEFARFFQTQTADIFIAPLVDNVFNRCKSPLKFLEYTVLGAPGVYSRLDPYEMVVRHGRNGLLAYSLDEWETCLSQLIEDAEARCRLAIQAQQDVRENWLLSQNVHRWGEILQDVLKQRRRSPKHSKLLTTIRFINAQLHEALESLSSQLESQRQIIQALNAQLESQQQTIQALNAQLESQRQTIQALNKEVLSYALSKSWRWTRPIRIVGRKLESLRKRNVAQSD